MSDKKSSITGQKRAGLCFSVSRSKQVLVKGLPKKHRLSSVAHVAFAAILEYVTAEVLEMSSIEAKNSGRKRITPHDICLGISSDQELALLFKNVSIKEGGVAPRYNRVSAKRYAKKHHKQTVDEE